MLFNKLNFRFPLGKGGGDAVAPSVAITALSGASNILAMQIVFSEVVTGFAVGDITISAGGSLGSFATADNKTFTVSWTLAAGANTMDIAAGVCADAAGNANTAATQFAAGYLTLQPDSTADIDTIIKGGDSSNYASAGSGRLGLLTVANRFLMRFDLTSVPAASTITSAIFTLTQTGDESSNARRVSLYRVLRDVVVTQANAGFYKTGSAWQTTMCDGALDREQTEFAGRNFAAVEGNGAKAFTLPVTTKTDFGSYGWLLKLSDETGDRYLFALCNNTTPADRPKLVVVYYINP